MRNSAKNNPRVTIIGAKDTGKSSLIKSLWGNEGIYREEIQGRGIISYEVKELPYIPFAVNKETIEWIHRPDVLPYLKSADVLVFVVNSDDIMVSRKASLMQLLRAERILCSNTKVIIALSQIESLIEIDEYNSEYIIPLTAASDVLEACQKAYFSFCSVVKQSFYISNIIPFSSNAKWQLTHLKDAIIEGIIKAHNTLVFNKKDKTIVFIGKTGCGKSSTINYLCDTCLPVDGSVACTKYPIVLNKEVVCNGATKRYNIIDLPGIAESLEANLIYESFYNKYLKSADVIVCLSQANTRAYTQDEEFYKSLLNNRIISSNANIILGINKVDLLFKSDEFLDGIDLNTINDTHPLLLEKIGDYYNNVFSKIFGEHKNVSINSVVPYSVYHKWNIEKLSQKIFI